MNKSNVDIQNGVQEACANRAKKELHCNVKQLLCGLVCYSSHKIPDCTNTVIESIVYYITKASYIHAGERFTLFISDSDGVAVLLYVSLVHCIVEVRTQMQIE